MQEEFDTHPELDIQLLGVNASGHESGTPGAAEGQDIPLLQDVDANGDSQSDVWNLWGAAWRDVIILDSNNVPVGTYNLFTYDLSDPENYATLQQMLVDAANASPPWQNPADPLDVNSDTFISPAGDVLPVVNELNNRVISDEAGRLPVPPEPPNTPPPYYDVNGDNHISAVGDVLPIVNAINQQATAEGEGVVADEFVLPTTTQSVHGVLSTDSQAPVNFPATYPSSSVAVGRPGSPPRVSDDGKVPSDPQGGEAHAGRADAEGSESEVGKLEPLLLDLAEDLARVWYEDVGNAL